MQKQLMMIAYCWALVCAAIAFSACNKILGGDTRGNYTIKGFLMDSCGGIPLANRTLVVDLTDHLIRNKHIGDRIASGTTDASGRFEIKCPWYGQGELRISDSTTGFVYAFKYPVNNLDSILDFGTMYLMPTYKASVNIRVKGLFAPSDTLFISNTPRTAYKYFYPITDTIYSVFFSGSINGYDCGPYKYRQGILFWGIGINDFMSTTKSEIFLKRICDYIDTASTITINNP